MPRRTVGIVELEWTCPTCQRRNPGSQKLCQGCGAAQPENVQFEAPGEQKLVTAPSDVERASKAPDIHCPYCDTRNAADAKICSQCGGDLTKATSRSAGNVVGSFQSTPKPPISCPSCGSSNPASATICQNCGAALNKARPLATIAPKQERGWAVGLVFLFIGLAMLIAFGFLIYKATRQETLVGTVQSASWLRTVDIQALVPVRSSDWEDELPADAEVESCQLEQRGQSSTPTENSREVCGTPYTIDKGTGYGEVVQDCWYEVYDNMCTYQVRRWQTVDSARASGAGFNPMWPELNLTLNQRISNKSEQFRCTIVSNDREFTYEPTSFAEYSLCEVGKRWQMNVNGFGSINAIQPLD